MLILVEKRPQDYSRSQANLKSKGKVAWYREQGLQPTERARKGMATADIRIIESTISEKYILGMASVSYRFNTGHKITPAPYQVKPFTT